MADPLGISASIAGLVTLADALYRTAFKYVKSAKNAHRDIVDLATETRDLAGVLHRLSILASALETDAEDEGSVLRLHHVVSCRTVLLRAELAISKAAAKFESGKPLQKVAGTLKWPFTSTETKEILDEVVRQKGTLTLALSADTMETLVQSLTKQQDIENQLHNLGNRVKEAVHIVTNIKMNEDRRRVLDFFMATNPQQSLAQSITLRHPQTGFWLVESGEFQQWLTSPTSNRIWLSGIPGAGKTILAGVVISEVLALASVSTGIAFFYCQYKDSVTQQPINLLKTIAAQLARQNQDAYSILEAYHKELQPTQGVSTSPTSWMMREVVEKMAGCFGSVYVIVDGVDECDENTTDVAELLVGLADSVPSMSICVLSRDEPEIRRTLAESFVHVGIEAQNSDVHLFVAAELDTRIRTKKLRLKNMSLKDEILHTLVQEHGGMFRWVACQLDYLCELPRDKDRRQALKSLPPTLNATYERILGRIETKGSGVQQLVQRCLSFLAVADALPTSRELCDAVSVDEDMVYLDNDALVDEESILEHCSSLVRCRESELDDTGESERYIEFSHFSVLEYLEGPSLQEGSLRKYRILRPDATKAAAVTCLRMLLLENMSYHPKATPEDFHHIAARCKSHPFLRYASLLWPGFARNHLKDTTVSMLVSRLFDPRKTGVFYSWCLELYLFSFPEYGLDWRGSTADSDKVRATAMAEFSFGMLQKGFGPLHMAATSTLYDVCEQLLESGEDCNATCRMGSPLHCAVSPTWFSRPGAYEPYDTFGSDIRLFASTSPTERNRVVQLLLQRGAIPTNAPKRIDEEGGIPLFQRCLDVCAQRSNFDMLLSLIESGISLDPSDVPVFEARMARGHHALHPLAMESLTQFLARLESIKTAAASKLQPALLSLINSGKPGLISMPSPLPQRQFASIRDPYSRAALAAQFNDRSELEDILGDNAFDLNKKINSRGETILHVAVRNISTSAVDVLVDRGCDQTIPDSRGKLPIWVCDHDSYLPVLRSLIRCKPDIVTYQNREGESIWHLAARTNSCQVLDSLFDTAASGAETQKNNVGFTPLALALHLGNEAAAAFIVRRLPDAFTSWTVQMPPMHLIAKSGSLKLAKTAMKAGVAHNSRWTDGSSPLHHLQPRATAELVRLLKLSYPDLLQQDLSGRRPIESFFINSMDTLTQITRVPGGPPLHPPPHRPLEGMLDRWAAVFDELIPADDAAASSDDQTTWERLCLQAGSHLGKAARRPGPLPGNLPGLAANGLKSLLETAILRLFERGLISLHETTRHESAILPLASSLCATFASSDTRLLDIVTMMLNFTQYPTQAIESQPFIKLLHKTVRADNVDTVLRLLQMGVNPLARADDGLNALEVACMSEVNSVLEILLNASGAAPLNELNSQEGLGLVHFISRRDPPDHPGDVAATDALKTLIKAGADPNLRTASGHSAVSCHVQSYNPDTANLLVDLGADPTVKGPDGYDAVVHAVLRGISSFLSHVYRLDKEGRLPAEIQWDQSLDLVWDKWTRGWSRVKMSMRGNTRWLLSDGVFRGCNLLHLATVQGHTSVMEFLLENKLTSNIDEQAEGGWTAMHFAAYHSSAKGVGLLHRYGADLNAVAHVVDNKKENNGDKISCRPLDIAVGGLAAKALSTLGAECLHPRPRTSVPGQELESDEESSSASSVRSPIGLYFVRRNMKLDPDDRPSAKGLPFLPALVMRDIARRLKPPLPAAVPRLYPPPGIARPAWSTSSSSRSASPAPPTSHHMQLLRPGSRYHAKTHDPLFSRLHDAVERDDLEECDDVKAAGFSINGPLSCGCAPLSRAITSERAATAAWLLNQGADTSALPCFRHGRPHRRLVGIPWLIAASFNARLVGILSRVLTAYLDSGRSVFNENRENPIHTAAQSQNLHGLRVIIQHIRENKERYRRQIEQNSGIVTSPDCRKQGILPRILNMKDDDGHTPLHLVRHATMAQILVDSGADVNVVDKNGDTPLLVALDIMNHLIAMCLLSNGANTELRNSAGDTALIVATQNSDLPMVSLLKYRANIYARTLLAESILTEAAYALRNVEGRSPSVVAEELAEGIADPPGVFLHLLQAGLDPNERDAFGLTPAIILLGAPSSWGLFLGGTISLDTRKLIPWTPLASYRSPIAALGHKSFRLLVRRFGLSSLRHVLNLHPSEGLSPLVLAAQFGFVESLESLLSIGANMEFEDSYWGITALMAACMNGQFVAIKFLVRRGARLNHISTITGRQTSAVIAASRHAEIVHWLLVRRYTDQEKLMPAGKSDEKELDNVRPWSGVTRAVLPLTGNRVRHSWDSSLDWLERLRTIRQRLGAGILLGEIELL